MIQRAGVLLKSLFGIKLIRSVILALLRPLSSIEHPKYAKFVLKIESGTLKAKSASRIVALAVLITLVMINARIF